MLTPDLSFEEVVQLYTGLLEQVKELDQHLKVLRQELLRTMDEMGIESVREDSLEVMRQVRHFAPRLDRDRAEALLRRHGRLQECLVTALDEDRAKQVLAELREQGRIAEGEMPLEYPPEREVLVVRRAA